jgi:hypothetical protein
MNKARAAERDFGSEGKIFLAPTPSPNIRLIKSRRMRWTGHIARMGNKELHTGFLWGDLREGDHLGDPGVDGRTILKWIFKKADGGTWTGLSWLRVGTGGGLL